MKKLFAVVIVALLATTLTACGSGGGAEWTRQGTYTTEDEKEGLMVYKSETEGYEGWSVGYYNDDQQLGWIIQQEGDSLKGNLVPPGEEGEFIVTVKEEGDDGLLLITPDNQEHHFMPVEMPDVIGTVTIKIEGMGQIEYAEPGRELEFSEHPFQDAVINVTEAATYTIGAKPADGWKFVKWTRDGQDFSEEAIVQVDLDGDANFVAVFEEE